MKTKKSAAQLERDIAAVLNRRSSLFRYRFPGSSEDFEQSATTPEEGARILLKRAAGRDPGKLTSPAGVGRDGPHPQRKITVIFKSRKKMSPNTILWIP